MAVALFNNLKNYCWKGETFLSSMSNIYLTKEFLNLQKMQKFLWLLEFSKLDTLKTSYQPISTFQPRIN